MLKNNKFFKSITKNFPLIISFFFWLILSIFLINFVNKLFQSSQDEIVDREKILIISLIILSLTLLIIIIVYLIKIIISTLKKEFGSMMRLKITLFFIIIALLPIVPFIQIGTKFIESSMNIWFSKNFGNALVLSEDIIKSYYEEKKGLLISYAYELNNKIESENLNYNQIINYLPKFISDKKLDNITFWSTNGQIINQLGSNIFDIDIAANKNIEIKSGKISLVTVKEGIFNTQQKEGKLFLIVPSKIYDGKNHIGFLNIAISILPQFNKVTEEIENALQNYNTVSLYKEFFTQGFSLLFIAIISPIILIILIISVFLTKELLDPIENLSLATRRVASGDLNFQIDSTFNDEFKVLSNSFNAMINELEISREKLQQKEKIATWQEMAKQLAHEIRNPLTPIRLSSERLLRKYNENSEDFEGILKKVIKTIITEVENMDKLLNEFSNFARLPEISKKIGGITEIINDSINLLSATSPNINYEVSSQKPDFLIIRDELLLRSVFMNIIKNSIDAMVNGGSIKIYLSEKIIGFKKYLEITIKDQGIGILEELGDVFSPSFSKKDSGRGLGLAIVQRIINEHEGRIYYTTEKNVGSNFIIEIPLADLNN